MQTQYIISSPQAMIDLGQQLVSQWFHQFGIIWELWAGKTHLVKGVALGIGLEQDQVHSPTYVYFHEYTSPIVWDDTWTKQLHHLLHVDMYRMNDRFLIIRSGLQEKLEEYYYQCIERPKMDRFESKEITMIHIEIIDDTTRKVIVDDRW